MGSRTWFAPIFGVSMLIAMGVMVGTSASAAAAASGARNPLFYSPENGAAAADAAAALLKIAQQRRCVRLIVQLHDIALRAASPAETFDAPSSGSMQVRLRSAQNALLTNLAAAGPGLGIVKALETAAASHAVVRFDSLPFMALCANAAEIRRLLRHPYVKSVQEDVPVRPLLAKSVPLTGAPQAWAAGFDGTGQAVAVLDAGVDRQHPMLVGKVVSESCYSTTSSGGTSLCPGGAAQSIAKGSGANCATAITGCDHGTHVASIAVGNSATLKGVAPGAKLVSIQVMSKFTNAADCSPMPAPCVQAFLSDIARGLERVYLLAQKSRPYTIAAAILSIGNGGLYASDCNAAFPALTAAINKLYRAGVATTIAAGNEGVTGLISAPACIRPAVAVGSTTKTDAVSVFSDLSPLVDLMAPGSDIRAAVPGGGLMVKSGTSFAAPHVAGAWAILRQAQPGAGLNQVLTALECTGKPVTRNGITKPRIQVMRALSVLRSPASGCR